MSRAQKELRSRQMRGRKITWGDKIAVAKRRHGASTRRHGWTGAYRSFVAAKARCQNPNAINFARYGGRGIEVKFSTFEEFLACLGERPAGRTLDRIDPDGHYAFGNVRWATPKEQRANQRLPAARIFI